MEKYTVSRELAEKLKGAGYPQKTVFGWALNSNPEYPPKVFEFGQSFNVEEWVAAPMSDELLEQLPWYLVTEYQDYDLIIRSGMAFYEACNNVEDVIPHEYPLYPHKPSIADALAQLWLYCKEHNLLDGEG